MPKCAMRCQNTPGDGQIGVRSLPFGLDTLQAVWALLMEGNMGGSNDKINFTRDEGVEWVGSDRGVTSESRVGAKPSSFVEEACRSSMCCAGPPSPPVSPMGAKD
jgi:hypothetical protein